MNINHEDIQTLRMHDHPEYLTKCCELINSEWTRSVGARMHSLQSSSDTLPTCLIMVYKTEVIGHCKLSRIPIKNSCFIESVVIEKNLRGMGLGSFLMQRAEEYCTAKLGLKKMYLSTKGQEKFYEKLGYKECEPVSIWGMPVIKPTSAPKVVVRSKTFMCKDL